MKIKSFLLFESKDSGYFLDLEEQISESFPTLRIKTYSDSNSGSVDINFQNDKDINFVEFVKVLEFWIEVLDNGGYRYSGGEMSLRKTYLSDHRTRNRNFRNWTDLKNYTLQFGGQEYSSIRFIKIKFN